jgi:hypothetical protein
VARKGRKAIIKKLEDDRRSRVLVYVTATGRQLRRRSATTQSVRSMRIFER